MTAGLPLTETTPEGARGAIRRDRVADHERATLRSTYVVERSVVVPLPLAEAWDALYGNQLQNWVALSDSVVEVRDYRMRDDGTPEYVMVNRMGPMRASHRSDYVVYEPPYRSADDTLESPLGGRYHVTHEQVEGGTRIHHRWNVEPHGPMRLLFPLIRPIFARSFQRDLDRMAERLAGSVRGADPV
jgi:hypothetical protein